MDLKRGRFPVGRRTLKTAAAVVVSLAIVTTYGATTSKLIFAVLGAMAAMQPTFKESLEACLTQIVGVIFGAAVAIVLIRLSVPLLVAAGVGIIIVITLYNGLHIRFSPSLSCMIVVTLCTTPDIQPMAYAFGRLWDTAIGLGIGMVINTLVFPYDNRRQIRATAESLDREVLLFLEEVFDGDDVLPNTEKMLQTIDSMSRQLTIFSKQWLILRLHRRRRELDSFRSWEGKARQLIAQMEVLCRMERPGRLNEQNRQRLAECGAGIRDRRAFTVMEEADVVTNYHVARILALRQELLDALQET